MGNVFLPLVSAAAILVGVSAPAMGQANCRLGSEIVETGRSGQGPAPEQTLSMSSSNWHALKRITNFESLNNACETVAVFGRMPGADNATAEVERALDECSGPSGDRITVGFDDNMEGGFITGIRVTTSGQANPLQRRVKAMRVHTAMVTDACNLVRFEWSPHLADVYARNGIDYGPRVPSPLTDYDERNRTDRLGEWQDCPRGYIATGIILARGWGGVSAVGLQCREVLAR